MLSSYSVAWFLVFCVVCDLLLGYAAGIITLCLSLVLAPLYIICGFSSSLVFFIEKDKSASLYWAILLTELIAAVILFSQYEIMFNFLSLYTHVAEYLFF